MQRLNRTSTNPAWSEGAALTTQTERRPHTFGRHETFHLRDGWLHKGLAAIKTDEQALYAKDAHHELGIGINMLQALIYWLQATNLVRLEATGARSRLPMHLTDIGDLVYTRDPYMEDIATIWLLHVELASNQRSATFWHWAFNEFPHRDFSEDRLVQEMEQSLRNSGVSDIASHSLHKDARCFVRTYLPAGQRGRKAVSEEALDCPLSTLGLAREGLAQGQYRFNVGQHRNLPLEVFAYTLYQFRERTRPNQIVLALDDLRWAPLSPGRLLCLDNRTILETLEELEHRTVGVQLIRNAGLNIVTLKEGITACDLLRDYYDQHKS